MAALRRSGVSGQQEVIAALRALSKTIDGPMIDEAGVDALEPMKDSTVQRIRVNRNFAGKYPGFPNPKSPRRGGHIDQGVVIRKEKGGKEKRSFKITATRRSRYLIHLLEFGTAPHFQPNFKGGFMHPGARAFRTASAGNFGSVFRRRLRN
jgi:hypothetical protein